MVNGPHLEPLGLERSNPTSGVLKVPLAMEKSANLFRVFVLGVWRGTIDFWLWSAIQPIVFPVHSASLKGKELSWG